MKRKVLICCLQFLAATPLLSPHSNFPKLAGPYLGQKPPKMAPEIFAPGIVSTGMSELNSAFTPDGMEFYFTVRNQSSSSIFVMHRKNDRWSEPRLLPFASRFGDIDVSIFPGGDRFFFCSRRPITVEALPKTDHDIWISERKDGSWGEPVHLGQSVNSDKEDFYPTTARNGNLYFNSQREGEGTNNIYISKLVDGHYLPAEKLGSEINSESRDFDPYISPDENFLIFSSTRPGGFGGSDLYISFRTDDCSWTAAVNMGDRINTAGQEFCAMLSPDGHYLFFTSSGRSSPVPPENALTYAQFYKHYNQPQNVFTDIYWVSAKIIEGLRPKN